jgi:hypothetical protein
MARSRPYETEMRGRLLALFIAAVLTLMTLQTRPARAMFQAGQPEVQYTFGEKITFQTEVQSSAPLQEATIFIQADGDAQTEVRTATVTPLENNIYQLSYTYDLAERPLRAFSNIGYWFQVKAQGVEDYTSPRSSFYYEDNRVKWQTLEESPFRVHWYEGEIAFGQSVLDVAKAGLQRVQSLLPQAKTPAEIGIYIYPSAKAMQATLSMAGQDWAAGHADPDLGVMVAALPAGPDQRLLMEERIPHELMHIMLYQLAGSDYPKLPTWLNEGLASISELYPNPDYQILLNNAHQKGTLLPIASLCQGFPKDASNALLAYAQTASFARYLQSRFGTPGIQSLVTNYANGLDCERGIQTSLGMNLTQLERQWRGDTLDENIYATAAGNLLPWFVILTAALVVPLGLVVSRLRRRPGDHSTETSGNQQLTDNETILHR